MIKISFLEKKEILTKLIFVLNSTTEKDFKKELAENLDDIVKLKGIYEILDKYLFKTGINLADHQLDKIDKDWFDKVKVYFPPVIILLEDMFDDYTALELLNK